MRRSYCHRYLLPTCHHYLRRATLALGCDVVVYPVAAFPAPCLWRLPPASHPSHRLPCHCAPAGGTAAIAGDLSPRTRKKLTALLAGISFWRTTTPRVYLERWACGGRRDQDGQAFHIFQLPSTPPCPALPRPARTLRATYQHWTNATTLPTLPGGTSSATAGAALWQLLLQTNIPTKLACPATASGGHYLPALPANTANQGGRASLRLLLSRHWDGSAVPAVLRAPRAAGRLTSPLTDGGRDGTTLPRLYRARGGNGGRRSLPPYGRPACLPVGGARWA